MSRPRTTICATCGAVYSGDAEKPPCAHFKPAALVETAAEWAEVMQRLEAANIAAGKCPKCGGAGVVANLQAIDRTGDPHINKRCTACRGTGKPR